MTIVRIESHTFEEILKNNLLLV